MPSTATVAQRPRARRTAALAPARSICAISQPPKMSPDGLVSAGIAIARINGSPSGWSTKFGISVLLSIDNFVPFSHHFLDHPVNVGKGGAKRANHLVKTIAPLLLARKRGKFHEIKGPKLVHPLKLTFINDFLNKTDDHRFVLRCCHRIFTPFQQTSGTLSTVYLA